ncbi:peptidase M23 [Paenibacillus sp. 32O-W]|nr:peptidase M23 [Paenibacillus sp. 32O-W]
MDVSGLIKKRAFWWVIGSLGAAGIAISLVVMLFVFALLGVLVSSSDTSSMEGIPVPENQTFDIPAPLLPIYIRAENEQASWARLAAIHKITTDFGAEQAKRIDTIGGLGFPRLLWEAYKTDGDGDGKIDPDNPFDAIFSLADYLRLSTLDPDAALEAWFLNPNDAALVRAKEAEYAAMLVMPRNWLWPVIGYKAISSPYGIRTDPVSGEPGAFHDGIDIPAPRGTPVVATQNGIVIQVVKSNSGYGNLVRLQHDGGVQSLYAHLSVIGVRRSQQVLRGEVIGWVGSTGKSTGPHLHFGMSQNGQSEDPQNYWND